MRQRGTYRSSGSRPIVVQPAVQRTAFQNPLELYNTTKPVISLPNSNYVEKNGCLRPFPRRTAKSAMFYQPSGKKRKTVSYGKIYCMGPLSCMGSFTSLLRDHDIDVRKLSYVTSVIPCRLLLHVHMTTNRPKQAKQSHMYGWKVVLMVNDMTYFLPGQWN